MGFRGIFLRRAGKLRPKSKTMFWVYALILLVLKMFMLSGYKMWALAAGGYDDGLMMRDAYYLATTGWLGPYSQVVLSKGMFFPLYLAILYRLGIPFVLSQIFLGFAACMTFVWSVRTLIRNRVLIGALFTILFFNPISFCFEVYNRLYRDSIYSYLVIFLISFLIALFLNRYGPIWLSVLLSIAAGVSLSAVALTREDYMWLIPLVAVALVMTVAGVLSSHDISHKAARNLLLLLIPAVLSASLLTVCEQNQKNYGVFMVNEFESGYLPRMIRDLSVIKPDGWYPRVGIPETTRTKAYAVSPTFAKIKKEIDAHQFVTSSPHHNPSCDILIWAINDSTYRAGYTTALSEQAFYKQCCEEIEAAEKDGRLQTRGGYVHFFVAPWDNRYIQPMIQSFQKGLNLTVYMKDSDGGLLRTYNMASVVTQEQVRNAERISNSLGYSSSEEIGMTRLDDKLVRKVGRAYSIFNPFFVVLGLLCYLYLTVRFILGFRKKQGRRYFECFLILSALWLSYLIRMIQLSYCDVASNGMMTTQYMAITYWLLSMASFTGVLMTVPDAISLLARFGNIARKRKAPEAGSDTLPDSKPITSNEGRADRDAPVGDACHEAHEDRVSI